MLVTAIGAKALSDLACKFARRRQDQSPAGFRLDTACRQREPVENRQCEGGGLTRARLREAQNIAPCHGIGNGLRLDRSRYSVILGRERPEDRLGEIQISKIGQEGSFKKRGDR